MKLFVYRKILYRYTDGSYTTGSLEFSEKFVTDDQHFEFIGTVEMEPKEEKQP